MYSDQMNQKMSIFDMLGVAFDVVKNNVTKFWVLFLIMFLLTGWASFIWNSLGNQMADQAGYESWEDYGIPQWLSGEDLEEYLDDDSWLVIWEWTGVVWEVDEGPQDTATWSTEPLSFLNILTTKAYAWVDEADLAWEWDWDVNWWAYVDGASADPMVMAPTSPTDQVLQWAMNQYGPQLQALAPYLGALWTMWFVWLFIWFFAVILLLSAIWSIFFYIWPSSVFNNIVAWTPEKPNNLMSKFWKMLWGYLLMLVAFWAIFWITSGLLMALWAKWPAVAIMMIVFGLLFIWVMIKLAFTFNAIIDDKWLFESIKYSWEITNNRWWLTFWNLIAVWLLSWIVSIIISSISNIHWILWAVLAIVSFAWTLVTQAWYVVLYQRYKNSHGVTPELETISIPMETEEAITHEASSEEDTVN
jgi:hypothetical protein